MSLRAMSHSNKLSLVGKIRPHRFLKYRLPDQQIENWESDLRYLKSLWRKGQSTELETDFFDWFDPSQNSPRLPEWLIK